MNSCTRGKLETKSEQRLSTPYDTQTVPVHISSVHAASHVHTHTLSLNVFTEHMARIRICAGILSWKMLHPVCSALQNLYSTAHSTSLQGELGCALRAEVSLPPTLTPPASPRQFLAGFPALVSTRNHSGTRHGKGERQCPHAATKTVPYQWDCTRTATVSLH